MTKRTIAVVGGTGSQGGGVVDALLTSGQYAIRVASRDPASAAAEALKKRGVQVVRGDLLEPSTLRAAFEGAHGAFLVTNFWDPSQMQKEKEKEIGEAAVKEARAAGVQHLIWSTLPDAEKLTGGRLTLRHFTSKARVDAAVEAAKFPRHTFVQAPFYFQNLMGVPRGGRELPPPMRSAQPASSASPSGPRPPCLRPGPRDDDRRCADHSQATLKRLMRPAGRPRRRTPARCDRAGTSPRNASRR